MRNSWASALILWLVPAVVVAAAPVAIVRDGKPVADVVVAADAPQQVVDAAKVLIDLVKEASGAALSVVAEPGPAPAHLRVGRNAYVDGLKLPLNGLDDDGFVIRSVDSADVVIVGPTSWGTEFGVYEFLERYVGVRWLLPGPDGTDVPRRATITVTDDTVRQQPAFFSRLFSGLKGPAQVEWARRNRMHGRVNFHHNLINLLKPSVYTKTHPEFFPIHGGKRYLPPTDDTHGWQPCFSAPGIVDEFIKLIDEYLDKNPEQTSVSLGVNDSGGHCECEACLKRDSGKKNFLGMRDVSDSYFEWANAVVEGVLRTHPNVYFGCLAYSEVAAPPTRVQANPRIIPYMTYDRMKWIDPPVRQAGEDATLAWQKASPTLGWYDYIYGSPYCLPRVWFHHMAKYYRFGRDHGVRCLYAEAYPNFGEGPKLYVSLKLQWNPDADVDALLRDWYERAVGKAAAPDLAAYYRLWEEFWTRRVLRSKWWTPGGQYLDFSSPGYLADVTDADLTKSRALLEATVHKAETPKQKARAEMLLRAFGYYEASGTAYQGARVAVPGALVTEDDALRMLDAAGKTIDAAVARQRLLESFANDPVLVQPLSLGDYPELSGESWGSTPLWSVYDWVAKGEGRVYDRVKALAEGPAGAAHDQAAAMLAVVGKAAPPISRNPSLEDGTGEVATDWSMWVAKVGKMHRTEEVAHTGKASILCDGVDRGGPNQLVPVKPGRYLALCFVYTPPGKPTQGTVQMAAVPREATGQRNLAMNGTQVTPVPGRWTAVATLVDLPAKIGNDEVKFVLLCPIVNGFVEGEKVYVDDIGLYEVGGG